jgi:hypothetical protein
MKFFKPALIVFLGGVFLCLFFFSVGILNYKKAEAAQLPCNDRAPHCGISSATVNGNTLNVFGTAGLAYEAKETCPAGSYSLCTAEVYEVNTVDAQIDSGSRSPAAYNPSYGSPQTCSIEGKETVISINFPRDISGLSVGNHTVEVRVMNSVNQETLCSANFYKPPSCTDECSPSGKRECTDGTHYRICGDYDADDCLEWSSTYSCGGGTPTCLNGYCRCQDQCPYETKRECQSPGRER